MVGFKKYITLHKKRAVATLRMHLILFSMLFILGVLMEFLLYGVFPDVVSAWITNTLDIIAWVFIWQFAAYMAFEFVREIREIKRLDQILNIQYTFRHWE